MPNLRQLGSKAEGARLVWALAGSGLAHALLLFAALPVTDRFDYQMVNAAPFSLNVQIAAAPEPVVALRNIPPPRRMRSEKLESPLAESREVSESPPALEPAEPEEQPVTPAVVEVEQYDPAVSVSESAYAGPLPRRLDGGWTSGEFLRDKQLDEHPRAIQIALPEYPAAALEAKAEGTILVALLVDESGRVVDAAPLDAAELLTAYAGMVADALRHSTFVPAVRDGVAVKAMFFQRVHFALQVTRRTVPAPLPPADP